MSENSDIWKTSKDRHTAPGVNSECPARWVIHCICCEVPVEPWQTTGYEFGYCASCFEILMEPAGKS
jgi:hypothetical protein